MSHCVITRDSFIAFQSQANCLMATSNTKMSSNINTNNNPNTSNSTRVISPLSMTSNIARPIIASSSSPSSLRRTDRRGRGLGWGHVPGGALAGLRGGMADTMSNGTSGWGPPPSGSGPGGGAGGGGSGWGAAPGAASAGSAWGSPAGDSNNANQEQLNANAAEGKIDYRVTIQVVPVVVLTLK